MGLPRTEIGQEGSEAGALLMTRRSVREEKRRNGDFDDVKDMLIGFINLRDRSGCYNTLS